MEATKKKKAYLKPEMNRFEMKTEGVMVSTSRPVIEEGEVVTIDCFTISNNSFVSGGSWSEVFKGAVGGEVVTTLKNLESNANILYQKGFNDNNCVKLVKGDPRCTINDDAITISVELISKDPCSVVSY